MKELAYIWYNINNIFIQKNKYVSSEGKLHILHDYFDCISGKYGNGSIPIGIYRVEKPIIFKDIPEVEAYKKEWLPWGASLTPLFNCDRTGLMIHPDGNLEGSLGCIAITKKDKQVFESLSKYWEKYELRLKVL